MPITPGRGIMSMVVHPAIDSTGDVCVCVRARACLRTSVCLSLHLYCTHSYSLTHAGKTDEELSKLTKIAINSALPRDKQSAA